MDMNDTGSQNCMQTMNLSSDTASCEDSSQVQERETNGKISESSSLCLENSSCLNKTSPMEKNNFSSNLGNSTSANQLAFPVTNENGQQTYDRVSKNGGMNVSHTESGYLTDSVISRERHCSHNSVGSNNSEQDVTPCAENLITFSTSSSNAGSSLTSPLSPDSEVTLDTDNSNSQISDPDDHVGQVNKIYNECTEIINETARIEQLESLARIDLNCDKKDINDIFATNFAPVRPENLVFDGEGNGARGRSQSEALDSLTGMFYHNGDKGDSRKRSKSSGFPIPRQKEGVAISEDMLSKSLPHGKVVKSDSGLIEFIADDLQEKIRMSSPMSKTGKFCDFTSILWSGLKS